MTVTGSNPVGTTGWFWRVVGGQNGGPFSGNLLCLAVPTPLTT